MKNIATEEGFETRKTDLDAVSEAGRLTELLLSPDPEARKRGWLEILRDNKPSFLEVGAATDPHYFDDVIEMCVKWGESGFDPDTFCVELEDYVCEAEDVFELEFLTYLSLAIKRGMPFEQAWARAMRMIKEINEVPRIVYELKPEDQPKIGLWMDRICHHGVAPEKAAEMAREITAILRQIFLTQDSSFYSWELEERDMIEREALLDRLTPDVQDDKRVEHAPHFTNSLNNVNEAHVCAR